MLKALLQTTAFLALGAATSLCSRAFAESPAPPSDDTSCGKCASGIGVWNEVFQVQTSTGINCMVWTIWWRKDGDCKLVEERNCVESEACKYMVQTGSTCGAATQELMYSVSSGGLLNFSTPIPGTSIVGAPRCNWGTQFTSCVTNLWTGASNCRTNWASCGPCPAGVDAE